jgi:hypothetical protein
VVLPVHPAPTGEHSLASGLLTGNLVDNCLGTRTTILEFPNQVPDSDTECVSNNLQALNGNVALAAFDLADMRPVQARPFGEHILR